MLALKSHRPALGGRLRLLLLAVALGIAATVFSPFKAGRVSAQTGGGSARMIAFDRDGEIFVMTEDGGTQTDLGPGYDPSWSPDGQRLAITFPDNSESSTIHVVNVDGSGGVALTDSGHDYGPTFSNDGSRIAFTSSRREDPSDTGDRVYLMNADGSDQHKLFANAPSGLVAESQPAWSPDGQRLAFIGESVEGGLSKEDVYVANADGTGLARLTNFGNIDLQNTLAWTRDGRQVAFTANRDIQTITVDGAHVLTDLTNSGDADEHQPNYTSDGTKIVYSLTNFNDGTTSGIYVMNADGTGATFTGVQGEVPEWKPEAVTQPSPTPTPDPTPNPTPAPTPDPSPSPSPSPTPNPTPAPTPQAELSVTLTATPAQPTVGGNLFYNLVVKNNGPDAASGIVASFIRPQGLDLVSASGALCSQSPQSPLVTVCRMGNIAAGSQTSISITTRPTVAGDISVNSLVNSTVADPDKSNNTQGLTLTVAGGACVEEITSSVGQLIVPVGKGANRQVRQVITARNNTGRTINGLVHFVFDGLPASVEGSGNTRLSRTTCAAPLGRKYVTVGAGRTPPAWKPGQVITLTVDFSNPARVPVNYKLRIYTGAGYP
jgi:uncharacterized repeat protein (TIGR01451 family)